MSQHVAKPEKSANAFTGFGDSERVACRKCRTDSVLDARLALRLWSRCEGFAAVAEVAREPAGECVPVADTGLKHDTWLARVGNTGTHHTDPKFDRVVRTLARAIRE